MYKAMCIFTLIVGLSCLTWNRRAKQAQFAQLQVDFLFLQLQVCLRQAHSLLLKCIIKNEFVRKAGHITRAASTPSLE
jgi:hypothetical protein